MIPSSLEHHSAMPAASQCHQGTAPRCIESSVQLKPSNTLFMGGFLHFIGVPLVETQGRLRKSTFRTSGIFVWLKGPQHGITLPSFTQVFTSIRGLIRGQCDQSRLIGDRQSDGWGDAEVPFTHLSAHTAARRRSVPVRCHS